MAFKFPAIFSRTDAKSRIFIVVATIVGVGTLIFFGSRFLSNGAGLSGQAKVANAPADLQSVPGGQLTPEYSRALAQENTQAAQKAQSTGGSSVATLVNVSSEQPQPANCTVVCPGTEDADVTGGVNSLVKLGKLSQADANNLLNMTKENVPVSEFASNLDTLVKQGKITPEQARKLLDQYTKQHANTLVAASAQTMDSLIKSGRLPVDVATQLLAAQKQNISAADYSAQLNKLVRDGKISPEVAAQLLAQYTQQKNQEASQESISALKAMARSGQISPDVADDLAKLQAKHVSVSDYQAQLNSMVAAGKMTPATAAKLLDQYRGQRTSQGPAAAVNGLVSAKEQRDIDEVNDLVKSGKISAATAATLVDMQKNKVPCMQYQKTLADLVQQGKMPAEDAKRLSASCDATQALRDESAKLIGMQGNNVSAAEYTAELTRAVKAGLISPEEAARLQQEYSAMSAVVSVPGAGNTQSIQTNVPGGSDFAKLQQRIQQQNTGPSLGGPAAVDNSQQFADAAAQAASQASAAAEQARQAKIQELVAAMSGQAHALITAWQPPVMQHKQGTAESSLFGKDGKSESSSSGGLFKGSKTTTTTPASPPIIKAGTIYFAVLDTGVNSDFPDTPVMATIIAGPYKGAKLLGKVTINSNPTTQTADRVSLQFNLMNVDSWPKSQTVTAFAIDPQTAKTVLASSVNYHYLLRYGSIMGSSFLSGYANAISNAGATTSTGIFGTTTTHPELSAASKLAVGLGQVGTTLGTATANYINTPPTVKVNAGVGLGILFMSDLTISM